MYRTQVQHILDDIKRLGSLVLQLETLMEDQGLYFLRDGSGYATIFMVMEDRLLDNFGVARCTRVIHIGQISAKGMLSASRSSQVQYVCLPWSIEDFLSPPRVQAPKRARILSQELRNSGVVFHRNSGICGFWPVERVAIGNASLGQDYPHTFWRDHPKPKQILLVNAIRDFLRWPVPGVDRILGIVVR